MSLVSPRVKSAVRYLGWADPIYKWRLSWAECPVCGPSLFISMRPSDSDRSAFLTRCFSCKANAVTLSLIPVIQLHFGKGKKAAQAYELSTYGLTLEYLKRHFETVTTSEYMPREPFGTIVNGVLNQDVQKLTFGDNSFDLITSNSVLEHVPDDVQAFRECLRTIKPGGAMIFSVPLYGTPETIPMAELTPDGIKFFREPEYHDSRFGGPKSALTFWRHSFHDICDRLRAAGWEDVRLMDVLIAPSQRVATKVVYAVKH
jgi:SAM-dependent methyltransferase